MNSICRILTACVLSVAAWLTPQPQLSSGLLVVYCTGTCQTVRANAWYHWPGYRLKDVNGCGLATISPLHLGQLAYISVDRIHWRGPCRVVDVVAQKDAAGSILGRGEVGEIMLSDAQALGFAYGGPGYLWLGACPPPPGALPQPYVVPRDFVSEPSGGPAIYNGGYPPLEPVTACPPHDNPVSWSPVPTCAERCAEHVAHLPQPRPSSVDAGQPAQDWNCVAGLAFWTSDGYKVCSER